MSESIGIYKLEELCEAVKESLGECLDFSLEDYRSNTRYLQKLTQKILDGDKRIADLESDKAELSEALETVWGAVTYWQGDDWVEDLIAKHKQPAKEEESSMFTDNHFPELKEQLDKLSVLGD